MSMKFLSDRVVKAARTIYSLVKESSPGLIRDRKHHLKTHRYCRVQISQHSANDLKVTSGSSGRQCCSGKELVDWLMKQNECLPSRSQAVGMWQVLVDEGILVHGESCVFVRFHQTY